MFNSLLNIYAHNVDAYYHAGNFVSPSLPDAQFNNVNTHLNFKTMIALVGIPVGVSVGSRTASILVELMRDNIDNFTIQRSTKHSVALFAAKGRVLSQIF